MNINEYLKIDKSFNSGIFISKVNYMIKSIYQSITLNKLDNTSLFMSNELYNKYKKMMDINISQGRRIVYDDINVNSEMIRINKYDKYFEITVRSEVKYLKYYVSLDDGSYISGDRKRKINNLFIVTLRKKINSSNYNNTYICSGCGASINIMNGFYCSKCGRLYDLKEYDYIINSLG